MLSAYQAICKNNQYLYGQLENLSLLMGHAMVHGLDDRYAEYSAQKVKLKKRIAENLEMMEEHWNASVRDAQRLSAAREDSMARKVINIWKNSRSITVKAIADRVKISERRAEKIITNYLTKKYDEVA